MHPHPRRGSVPLALPAILALLLLLSSCSLTGPIEPTVPAQSPDLLPASGDSLDAASLPGDLIATPEVSDPPLDAEPFGTLPPEQAIAAATIERDLWRRLRTQFELPRHLHRKRVQSELQWLKSNPEYVARVTRRASRYLHHITESLDARDMPLDIALLPVVESAFDPYAYSHGRASGLWQFIPSTARLYGLKIDWWYDGRRDVVQSTHAALDYLEYLSRLYDGNWLLALAAYNSGQGNVNAAIRKNRRLGRPLDFWSLPVPRETSAYVPRLLAVIELVSRPEHYGVRLHPIANEPQWEVVDIGSQTDLTIAADLTGMDSDEFYQLNAGYNQWSTHPDGPHQLLVHSANVTDFRQAISSLPKDKRLTWTRHKIKQGESLGVIARRYNVSVASLKSSNDVRGNLIVAGDYLLVPVATPEKDYPMTADNRLSRSQDYYEKKYGPPITHTVKDGESFWKIASQYGVGMRELARWNGKGTTSLLRAGETLLVFKSTKRPMVRKVNYRVRRGESLSLIANRFNVTINSIRSWNEGLDDGTYIHPGDRLTLFVDISATE